MRSLSVLMFTPIWPSAEPSCSGLILLFLAMPASTLVTSSSLGVMPSFLPCWICSRSSMSMSVAFFFRAGGLLLGGDGEKALALLDVVDGDGVVVDEHDDRLLGLRPGRRSYAAQAHQNGKHRDHRNAGAPGLVQVRHHCRRLSSRRSGDGRGLSPSNRSCWTLRRRRR